MATLAADPVPVRHPLGRVRLAAALRWRMPTRRGSADAITTGRARATRGGGGRQSSRCGVAYRPARVAGSRFRWPLEASVSRTHRRPAAFRLSEEAAIRRDFSVWSRTRARRAHRPQDAYSGRWSPPGCCARSKPSEVPRGCIAWASIRRADSSRRGPPTNGRACRAAVRARRYAARKRASSSTAALLSSTSRST
jgi:hypothetical protein